MQNLAVIQARMGSTRLPNKVLKDLAGKPALWHVITRVKQSKLIDEVVVATTYRQEDLQIVKTCVNMGVRVFVGSENDVLDRYYQAARLFQPENVVRITADCPLQDGKVIDEVILKHMEEGNDYTSNVEEITYPDGLDCEVMKFSVLKEAWKNANLLSEREHVTPYIRKNEKFKIGSLVNSINRGFERWTLDTDKDYELIKAIYNELYKKNELFSSEDIYELLDRKPELRQINKDIIRNEGAIKSLKEDRPLKKEEMDFE